MPKINSGKIAVGGRLGLSYKNFIFALSALALTLLFPKIEAFLETKQAPSPEVLGVQSAGPPRGEKSLLPSAPVAVSIKPVDLSALRAESVLAYDSETGQLLAEKNADTPFAIASLTKLLTALVVYDRMDMEETVSIASRDVLPVSPALYLRVGDGVKAKDLFNAMLIGSCNDAALTLANHAAAKAEVAFDVLMNKKALELGMKNSHFSNPLGFDSAGNFATARDLKLLAGEAAKYSVFEMTGRKLSYEFIGSEGHMYSTKATNKLIAQDPEISNIKTGYTEQALGSMIVEATQDGHSIVLIVIRSPSREQDTLYLKKQIFESFKWE